MYLQTLILLLSEQGPGTIAQESLAGYPDLIRQELEIEEDMTVLCGLAIGFTDETSSVNMLRMPRHPWEIMSSFWVTCRFGWFVNWDFCKGLVAIVSSY